MLLRKVGTQEEFFPPYSQAYNLSTISLPFPFGFSGIYSDGGTYVSPFQVTVWANGLLTFDSSVSFNPYNYALDPVPSDCSGGGYGSQNLPNGFAKSVGAVSDTFGGFPFVPKAAGPPNAIIAPWWGDLLALPQSGTG